MSQQVGKICVLSNCSLDRAAYQALLRGESFAGLVQRVTTAELNAKAVWTAIRERPDVFIIDADRANGTAFEMVEMIQRLSEPVGVVILSRAESATEASGWGSQRIDGIVCKEGGEVELFDALRAVASGSRYVSPPFAHLFGGMDGGVGVRPRLTPRELELLPLLARGMRLKDAATKLAVSYKTADAHRTRLLKKLGVRDRVELARYAIREGIIDP